MGNEDEKIELKAKRFFLDRLVIKGKGPLGRLFPFIGVIMWVVLGIWVGIYPNIITGKPGVSDTSAQISYSFWIGFMFFSTYFLDWFVVAINKYAKAAGGKFNVTAESYKKSMGKLFGFKGVLISILIALPFIIYDVTGFFLADVGEGWIVDVTSSFNAADDSWYPGILTAGNATAALMTPGALLWIAIWSVAWFYQGAFTWISLAFVQFVRNTLKKRNWKDDIQKIIKEMKYKALLGLSVLCYLPLAPYIALKFLYQYSGSLLEGPLGYNPFQPWYSDEVSMYILFILFIVGIIAGPYISTRAFDKERNTALQSISGQGGEMLENAVKSIMAGKDVDINTILKTLLLDQYKNNMTKLLSQKLIDSGVIKKIVVAAAAPVFTYLLKIFGPYLAQLGMTP